MDLTGKKSDPPPPWDQNHGIKKTIQKTGYQNMGLTGKKSGPPPWDQQLVRVARADNNWGPLVR